MNVRDVEFVIIVCENNFRLFSLICDLVPVAVVFILLIRQEYVMVIYKICILKYVYIYGELMLINRKSIRDLCVASASSD